MPSSASAATPTAQLPPYLDAALLRGDGRSVFIETYGCQMNVSDTEVVRALLNEAGYARAMAADSADVVLINTCAIREGAEAKIWNRLRELRAIGSRDRRTRAERGDPPRLVGVLGCMGERLKGKLLEAERLAHVVCGPDAYRSLPRLLAQAGTGQPSLDVALSIDETYADVAPVREGRDGVSAFVSVMRGCNNMCSYCIVPFTRGRERSRPGASIMAEVDRLAEEGYKEVTLLGQNVNSYADSSEGASSPLPELREGFKAKVVAAPPRTLTRRRRLTARVSPHATRMCLVAQVPPAKGDTRFAEMISVLAEKHPEMRFRFTSPHPKDFPDPLLHAIAEHPNVCNSLHIPAQSGSTAVLEAMRRGYSRETYLTLVERVRELLPGAALSSDFISGYCGETAEDHEQTLSLLREVRFEKAFMFAYSMREKTHAHR